MFLLDGRRVLTLDDYRAIGGGEALATAERLGPALVRKEVLLSGLRGRGGAGFRTGRKWTGVVESAAGPRYAVCNAAEGEPGTFKDRALLRHDPYATIEGLAVAAYAVEATSAFIATKARYEPELDALRRALTELGAAGLLGGIEVSIVEGPDEYLFGEEKALLEVIEGRDPLPRLLPPFEQGLFVTDEDAPHPTVVNNVETLANVPFILARGADWFRSVGTADSPGTLICTVVGDVAAPCVVEVAMGTPLAEVIDVAGGPVDASRAWLGCFSGVANPVIPPERFGTPLSYEAFAAAGLGMGSAGFVLYDDTACPVEIARALSRFLYVESCGQCRSCKYGCGEITRRLERVNDGVGTETDVEVIGARLRTVTDAVRCYLANEEQALISSILTRWPEEFALHLEGRCSVATPRHVLVPKLVDVSGGVAVYDETHDRKQPDWTFADPRG